MTEQKGHVPEDNLNRYRALKRISDQYDKLGNMLGDIGHIVNANEAYEFSAIYKQVANDLRVTLEA